jgi:hypothetical protein
VAVRQQQQQPFSAALCSTATKAVACARSPYQKHALRRSCAAQMYLSDMVQNHSSGQSACATSMDVQTLHTTHSGKISLRPVSGTHKDIPAHTTRRPQASQKLHDASSRQVRQVLVYARLQIRQRVALPRFHTMQHSNENSTCLTPPTITCST